jgi:hypothetical protein
MAKRTANQPGSSARSNTKPIGWNDLFQEFRP